MPAKLLNVEIDRWTNSLVHSASGVSYATETLKVSNLEDFSNEDWIFDWSRELGNHEVWGIYTPDFDPKLQGLVSLSIRSGYVEVVLAEAHQRNRKPEKTFIGVGAHLFAFACERSRREQFGGFVVFTAKSNLIQHYSRTLGAKQLGRSLRMTIDEAQAYHLIRTYYNDEHEEK